jgi:hypothetical protein
MPDLKPLVHSEVDKKDDATLRKEAEAHFQKHAALQVVAELLLKLRARTVSWWSGDDLRVWWNATERLRWLRQRVDLREQITSSLTGLAHSAARKKTPEFQGGLLDSFLEDGDVTLRQFEEAFDPVDLAVYGPATQIWKKFRERFPWDQDGPVQQELVAFLLRALLADKSPLRGATRTPVLGAWELRTGIPSGIWQTRIPADVRASIDDVRLQREKSREPFGAAQELAIATPDVIAACIPLRELTGVLDLAQAAMGFDGVAASARTARAKDHNGSVLDTDMMLASIAKRASSKPPPPNGESKPSTSATKTANGAHGTNGTNGYLALSTPSLVKPKGVWPDDVDDDLAVPTRKPLDDDTQPRARALAR